METNMEDGEEKFEEDKNGKPCHLWLKQRLTPRKTASIMIVVE